MANSFSSISFQLSAFSYQLSGVSFQVAALGAAFRSGMSFQLAPNLPAAARRGQLELKAES
jgi:hypothetical protein